MQFRLRDSQKVMVLNDGNDDRLDHAHQTLTWPISQNHHIYDMENISFVYSAALKTFSQSIMDCHRFVPLKTFPDLAATFGLHETENLFPKLPKHLVIMGNFGMINHRLPRVPGTLNIAGPKDLIVKAIFLFPRQHSVHFGPSLQAIELRMPEKNVQQGALPTNYVSAEYGPGRHSTVEA